MVLNRKKPVWDDKLQFQLSKGQELKLEVTIMDKDMLKSDDIVATGTMGLEALDQSNQIKQELQLFYEGKFAGDVMITVHYEEIKKVEPIEKSVRSGLLHVSGSNLIITKLSDQIQYQEYTLEINFENAVKKINSVMGAK